MTVLVARIGRAARGSESLGQLVRFAVVGGSGYALNLLVFGVLVNGFGVGHVAAAVIAFCFAVANNFVLNRHWTFTATASCARRQALRFAAVSLAGLSLNLTVLELLVAGGLAEIPAQAMAVAMVLPFNFMLNKLWTFAAATEKGRRDDRSDPISA